MYNMYLYMYARVYILTWNELYIYTRRDYDILTIYNILKLKKKKSQKEATRAVLLWFFVILERN